MDLTVEKMRNAFLGVEPVLFELFDLNSHDLNNDRPNFRKMEEYGEINPEEESAVFYDGATNCLVVNEKYDNKDDPIRIDESNILSLAGEEAVHWLRQGMGAEITEFMEIPHPQNVAIVSDQLLFTGDMEALDSKYPQKTILTQEQYNEIISGADTKTYMKGCTVDEFFGAVGQNVIADAFDCETLSYEIDSWGLGESSFLGSKSASVIRRGMWDEDLEVFMQKVEPFWDDVAHLAGYKAAEDKYEIVISDPNVLSGEPGQVWQEYNLSRYEEEAIRELR